MWVLVWECREMVMGRRDDRRWEVSSCVIGINVCNALHCAAFGGERSTAKACRIFRFFRDWQVVCTTDRISSDIQSLQIIPSYLRILDIQIQCHSNMPL